MVPCYSCRIYGILTRRSKKVWGCLIHQLSSVGGGDENHKRQALFIGNTGSHYAILLYCETLSQVLVGIYCKKFIEYLFSLYYYCFTCLKLAKPKVQLKVS